MFYMHSLGLSYFFFVDVLTDFRHVCHKWHYKITKAMVVCLDSGDYVQIRNALIVLIRVLPHFPVLEKLAQIIERKVDKVYPFFSSVNLQNLYENFL